MECVVTKEELSAKLGSIQGIMEVKETLPIISHFLLKAKKEKSVIQATNLDRYVRQPIQLICSEEGDLCIPGRKLFEIVKELEGEIHLTSKEEGWLILKAGKSSFKVACLPPKDFPTWPKVDEKAAQFDIEPDYLRQMINKTLVAVSESVPQAIMKGLLLHVQPAQNALVCVGTDGHRLCCMGRAVSFAADAKKDEVKAVVGKKSMMELKKFLETEAKVNVTIGKSHVLFSVGAVDFAGRLIEGEYPNYMQIIPKNETKVSFGREKVMKALKRCALMTNGSHAVEITFKEGSLVISGKAASLGDATEELAIDFTGDRITMGMNPAYFIDGLAVSEGENVRIEIKDALSPVALKDTADPGYIYIAMPVRM